MNPPLNFYRRLTYRETLLKAAISMDYLRHDLFSRIVEITSGEVLKEWSSPVLINESMIDRLVVLERKKDENASILIDMVKMIEEKLTCLGDNNYITNKEIEEFEWKLWFDIFDEDKEKINDLHF
ncbi:MAG: hypothetical protein ABIN01_09125 [Ferruginibacter sp.]